MLNHYECVVDSAQPVGSRLDAARKLAVRLVRNEVDHHRGAIGASDAYADDLNRLIHDHIESRFSANTNSGRRYIGVGAIESTGGWGAFLWRGAMVQHLYTLNSYRNDFTHLPEKPYADGNPCDWTFPRDTLDRVGSGEILGAVAEHIVRELLDWYLPWHEQIYIPWAQEQS